MKYFTVKKGNEIMAMSLETDKNTYLKLLTLLECNGYEMSEISKEVATAIVFSQALKDTNDPENSWTYANESVNDT